LRPEIQIGNQDCDGGTNDKNWPKRQITMYYLRENIIILLLFLYGIVFIHTADSTI